MKGTWQTTEGGGGGGLVTVVLIIVGAALAVKAAPAVLGAAAEVLRVFLIVAGVVAGAGAAALVGLLAWRWRSWQKDVARARLPHSPELVRAAQPLPGPRPAIERAPEIHLHLHGVSAEDAAAIIRRQQDQ
jgi:hypothetical protein